ncbi:hypothetical protein OSB04_014798 [Centaurea solstitialis]|uniref:Uncharacterized protein n=1 Tax=Centaurea solstitialis TaxID=347529 RepID=A0AA38SXY2_9ASTR|nr:hypothetical protein OSB04_014798 [Centaurea solstitialis]
MAAPKQRLFFCITLILFLFASSETLDDDDDDYQPEYDSSLQIQHQQLLERIHNLESSIEKRSHEINSKDERIKTLETTVVEKSNSLASLNIEIQSLQKKESSDANEQVGETLARAAELEKQVENLKREIERQNIEKDLLEARINVAVTKIEELNVKLEQLQRINKEQKIRIRNTERALQKAEEERTKVQFNAARYAKELEEDQLQSYAKNSIFAVYQIQPTGKEKSVLPGMGEKRKICRVVGDEANFDVYDPTDLPAHESWLPPWLAAHLVHCQSFVVTNWNVHGRPALDFATQKVLETEARVRRWAWPYIDVVHTKWIPIIKEQWLTFVTNMEPHAQILTAKAVEIYDASKKNLRPHIASIQTVVDPYIKEAKKLMQPYINHLSKTLKPHLDKARIYTKPYTKRLLRGYRRIFRASLRYHHRVRANIQETLKHNEFTRPLASNELVVGFMASSIIVFPVMYLLTTLSSLFSKKPRRRSRSSHTNHPRRRAKRGHQDRANAPR